MAKLGSTDRRIGPYEFLALVTLMAAIGGVLYLLRPAIGNAVPLPVAHYLPIVFGMIWLRWVGGRVRDAGLPSWYSLPYYGIFSFSLVWLHYSKGMSIPWLLALFVVLQIPTVFLKSKPESAPPESEDSEAGTAPDSPRASRIEPVGPIPFVLRTALIAASWAAIFHLAQRAGSEVALWGFAGISGVLGLIWLISVDGRFKDAKLPPWNRLGFQILVPLMSILPFAFQMMTIPQVLVLFVVLQIPIATFRSRLAAEVVPARKPFFHREPTGERRLSKEGTVPNEREFQRTLFTVSVLAVTGLWEVLYACCAVADDRTECLWLGTGACFIGIVWFVFFAMRLGQVGIRTWHSEAALAILVLSFSPYAYEYISFQQALVLFVGLQIPVFVARTQPREEDALTLDEPDEASIEGSNHA